MLALAIATPSHHAAHVPAGRGEAIVTRNLIGIFATDVLAPAPRGLKKPADLREDLDWETSILLGPISSCDYHFPSVVQHGEPAAEKSAGREPPADSPRLENQAMRRATNTEPDRRASVTFLFPCAFMLAALSLAASRGLLLRGRQEKKSMHGRTRAAGAAHLLASASAFRVVVLLFFLQDARGTQAIAPPLSPPQLPPPLPLAPLPPLPPNASAATEAEQLRSLIEEATADMSVYLAPGTHLELSDQVNCTSNITVTVASSGEGATLDGQGQTGLFYLSGGCSLTLQGLLIVNGWAERGGVVEADGAGNVEIIGSTLTNCSAYGHTTDGAAAYMGVCCVCIARRRTERGGPTRLSHPLSPRNRRAASSTRSTAVRYR